MTFWHNCGSYLTDETNNFILYFKNRFQIIHYSYRLCSSHNRFWRFLQMSYINFLDVKIQLGIMAFKKIMTHWHHLCLCANVHILAGDFGRRRGRGRWRGWSVCTLRSSNVTEAGRPLQKAHREGAAMVARQVRDAGHPR